MEMHNASKAWKSMRVQPVENTLDFDINNNIYIVRADRRLKHTRFLGLYKDKSVKAVGMVIARTTAIMTSEDIEYEIEFGNLTGKRIKLIETFLNEHHLDNDKHRFFFVDKFYMTDFKKTSSSGLQRSKIFDLTQVLGKIDIPDAETLAKLMENKTWE